MPATYTHHVFTKDVFKNLNVNIQDKMKTSTNLFNLFGKSFDVLFFKNFKLGTYAHANNVNLYFYNIIKYIRENNLTNNSDILAYLYGSICHYVLDSTVHPYVYYKTGKYNASDKTTYKYKGKHTYLEYMIDAHIYLERNKKEIYKANIAKEVMPKITFSDELTKTIDYAFLNTFDYINVGKLYYSGYKNYRFILKHGMTSRFGIKYYIYKIVDTTKIFKKIKFQNYSYYIKKLDNSVLNLEHKKWCYPVNKNINYHYSFYDLYDIAIEKAKTLINELDNAINLDDNAINIILEKIGNTSYYTGIDANKKSKTKYFQE